MKLGRGVHFLVSGSYTYIEYSIAFLIHWEKPRQSSQSYRHHSCRPLCKSCRQSFLRNGHHTVNKFAIFLFIWCCEYCFTNSLVYSFEVSYYGAYEGRFLPSTSFFTGLKDSSRASRNSAPFGKRHVCPNNVSLRNLHATDHCFWLVIL